VSWDGRPKVMFRVVPDRVVGSLTHDLTAVLREVSFENLPFQAAARSMVICSACPLPIGGSFGRTGSASRNQHELKQLSAFIEGSRLLGVGVSSK
jgi:hypothetical protein